MSAEQLLAIDHGTQSVRALIDRASTFVKSQVPIEAYFNPPAGVQDARFERAVPGLPGFLKRRRNWRSLAPPDEQRYDYQPDES